MLNPRLPLCACKPEDNQQLGTHDDDCFFQLIQSNGIYFFGHDSVDKMVINVDSYYIYYLAVTLLAAAIVSWFLKLNPGPKKEQVGDGVF